jgi:hypothetical protein
MITHSEFENNRINQIILASVGLQIAIRETIRDWLQYEITNTWQEKQKILFWINNVNRELIMAILK